MLSAQCSDNNVLHTAKNVMINPMENEPKTQIEDQEKKTLCRRVKSYFFLHPSLKGQVDVQDGHGSVFRWRLKGHGGGRPGKCQVDVCDPQAHPSKPPSRA